MGEDRFEMGQKERDRLKILHEAQQGQITQVQAGQQLGITGRQVRRLLRKLREQGDRAVIHGLRGRASNRFKEAVAESRGMEELQDQLLYSDRLLTAKEVARVLVISEKTAYSYVSKGLLPYYKIQSSVRFRARDVDAWLSRQQYLGQ
jgi:excisionase family DNA binding protein